MNILTKGFVFVFLANRPDDQGLLGFTALKSSVRAKLSSFAQKAFWSLQEITNGSLKLLELIGTFWSLKRSHIL